MTEQQEKVREAIGAMRNLGVSLNDYDSDMLEILYQFAEDSLATNAAQAEQLAKLEGALRSWLGIAQHCSITDGMCCCGDNMAGHYDAMQCGHMATDHGEYVTSLLVEETNALLQSSIPPEPQAGVELTEVPLNIIRYWPDGMAERLEHVWKDLLGFIPNYKLLDLQTMLAEYGFEMKIYERSLNQRQAVKAEPLSAAQGVPEVDPNDAPEECEECGRGTQGLSGDPKWCSYCGAKLTGKLWKAAPEQAENKEGKDHV